VILSGRRKEKLLSVAKELVGSSSVLPCDVTDEIAIEKTVNQIILDHGQLDIVVANAGFAVNGTIDELSKSEWQRQFDVNVFGLCSTAKFSLPHLRKSNGRLVLIGSGAAWLHLPRSTAYCASKAAVHAIGNAISMQLHGTATTCTTIHPGFVESEIAQVDNNGVFDAAKPDRRPKNLMWTSEQAAIVMVNAIAKRKRSVVFTWHAKFGVWLARFFPSLSALLLRKFG
jgi:short-subunit dehydrogenase